MNVSLQKNEPSKEAYWLYGIGPHLSWEDYPPMQQQTTGKSCDGIKKQRQEKGGIFVQAKYVQPAEHFR